jgi:hypothetical protein
VLVPPSPKLHCQEVGLPVEVSVNCTACPATGEAGVYVKDAVSVAAGRILTVWLVLLEPVLPLTVKVTVKDETVVYVWLGFREVEVDPSPKLHCQEVGDPVDVSVNCTAWPATGEAGAYVKEALSVDGWLSGDDGTWHEKIKKPKAQIITDNPR